MPSDTSTISNDYEQGVGRTLYGLMRSAGDQLEDLVDKVSEWRRPQRKHIIPFTCVNVSYSVASNAQATHKLEHKVSRTATSSFSDFNKRRTSGLRVFSQINE